MLCQIGVYCVVSIDMTLYTILDFDIIKKMICRKCCFSWFLRLHQNSDVIF